LKFIAFVLCFVWLVFFTLMGSIHDYEWMIRDSEIGSWCRLPPEQNSTRGELYLLFLLQFGMMSLVFLRKKNISLTLAMIGLFLYATYAFIGRDMLC